MALFWLFLGWLLLIPITGIYGATLICTLFIGVRLGVRRVMEWLDERNINFRLLCGLPYAFWRELTPSVRSATAITIVTFALICLIASDAAEVGLMSLAAMLILLLFIAVKEIRLRLTGKDF